MVDRRAHLRWRSPRPHHNSLTTMDNRPVEPCPYDECAGDGITHDGEYDDIREVKCRCRKELEQAGGVW